MLSFLLNGCYLVVAICAAPWLLWQSLARGKRRGGWLMKLTGHLPRRQHVQGPRVWLHAVSVGEVLQLRQIVQQFRSLRPDSDILITTTTATGFAVAQENFSDCDVAYFPFDFSWSVQAALDRAQPDLIVLVELELWPQFIFAASRRRIPMLLVNGRLSARSYRGYAKIRPLIQRLFHCFSVIAVQSEEYQKRFLALGAAEAQVVMTGSIKFDGVVVERDNAGTAKLRNWMQIRPGQRVLIAGSTQDPEEEMVLNVFASLREQFADLRLILVPRHPERGATLAESIARRGWNVVRRSSLDSRAPSGTSTDVGLLDTVGELGACWGLADIAFVGGSFTNRGGQNMLEPAAYGAAVCFGPNTWNFHHVVQLLEQNQAACTVRSEAELHDFARTMLADRQQARQMGQRAQELILRQQGATARSVALMQATLSPSQDLVNPTTRRAA